MKNLKFLNVMLFLAATLFMGCNPNEETSSATTENGEVPTDNNSKYDIYVLGHCDHTAQYWKNGERVTLGEGEAKSIAVNGSDVYVAGHFNGKGSCLKNGTPITLSGKSEYVNTVVVNNNDVYVGGNTGMSGDINYAAYWKNGTFVQLPTDAGEKGGYGVVTAMYVENENVYAVGANTNGARLWVNGTASRLSYSTPSATYTNSTAANDIFVSNGNTYVVGSQYAQDANASKYIFTALYWQNGIVTALAESRMPGGSHIDVSANAVTVAGNDVYIAGSVGNSNYRTVATYWKNGQPIYLTNGEKNAVATDIAVVDNDIYVVFKDDSYTAKYWKNGQIITLGEGVANKIVIVKK